ncbi:hypothetical protein SNE35_04755 [Paucibacter sp. R3-3]|uniref:Uncharacterized protein n=1 Tax=Roseateles agri TaxID=3098619 RepID=A0ABU5DCD8_9BURK|nr:hypothetical protein [Paucibacter sp. R3-3]MDY0743799.1 hypothetical protein [Paucibacter sp. R3-3]
MTLTTYRSPAARLLHAALDLAHRARRALRTSDRPATRVRAFTVLEVATMRDLRMVPRDFESFGAQVDAEAPSRVTPGAVVRA